jgi:hypothetical protein
VLGQKQLECFFARSVGHRHRFKIDRRLIDWGISPGTVNLPAPRFGIVGPDLNDDRIVVRLKISEHARQYALSSHQRLVAINRAGGCELLDSGIEVLKPKMMGGDDEHEDNLGSDGKL